MSTASLLVFVLGVLACGDVYEELRPAQKDVVAILLTPDFVRQGETSTQMEVFLDVPGSGTFVTDIDMGAGIVVLAAQDNQGCGFAQVPSSFENTDPFKMCLTLEIDPGTTLGERTAQVDLSTDAGPTVARSVFFVLRSLQ